MNFEISIELARALYIGATVLFILTLGGLSNQESARKGNMYGMLGMSIAIIAGLITSIALETFILLKLMSFKIALKTAIGMSFISMLVMEVAMNTTDFMVNGAAVITLSTVPIILIIGFLAPLPYNYWRLKKFGISCH